MSRTPSLQETAAEGPADVASTGDGASTTDEATQAGDESSPRGDLPLDLAFESLKNSRRRQVLRYLQRNGSGATVGELAEHVAAIENDKPVEALSSQQRKRVYVGLYQCHLPKLDDKDVIDYDENRGTVRLGPNAAQLARYLDVAERTDDSRPWPTYYLGLAAVGAIVLASAIVALGGSGVGTAGMAVGFGLVVSLACLSIVHAAAGA